MIRYILDILNIFQDIYTSETALPPILTVYVLVSECYSGGPVSIREGYLSSSYRPLTIALFSSSVERQASI
ncbi:hypothetical protein I7I53_00367 [Histoplasma capsulatum var. duboisii H88]|uniref:Uncharacterized protein n=1 Tax=Ajellomyces capsulatus (strain H88) TaxID=544711 RepID=A0A8A1LGK9_AJEC8|nr:hypothetical protein I7I53_00367 [Histoplasma capsulatum var. duboisii H88]